MSRVDLLQETVGLLRRENYETFVSSPNPAELCFEIIASSRLQPHAPVLILKLLENIDKKTHFFESMLLMALIYHGAVPLVIGNQNRRGLLEDGVVYARSNVLAINHRTFQHALLQSRNPTLLAKRGGFVVQLDSEVLRAAREARGYSRQTLGDLVGVSSKAIFHYENGAMNSTVEVAESLERVLETSLVQSIDLFALARAYFQSCPLGTMFQQPSTGSPEERELGRHIEEIANEAEGVSVFWARDTPFDLFVQAKGMGFVHEITTEFTEERVANIGGFFQWHRSRNGRASLMVDEMPRAREREAYVTVDEFEHLIKKPEELVKLINKRLHEFLGA
jgi:predicted transcriptional regulator